MPGYNLQTYKDMFLAVLTEWSHQTTVPLDLPESLIFTKINDGLAQAQRELGIQTLRERKALTVNVMSYDIPLNVLGKRINKVEVLGQTGADRTDLVELDYSQFVDLYDQDNPSSDTGSPLHWTYAAGFATPAAGTDSEAQILIGPPPSYTRSNGLIFYAYAESAMSGRNLQGAYPPSAIATTVKASVSNGGKVVTFHDQADALENGHIDIEMRVGDEFGFMPTTHSDGTTIATTSPFKWYSIAWTDSASSQVTLAETFRERGVTKSTSWISAEVSEIERAWPGMMGWTPVYFALHQYLAGKDPGKADYFRALAVEGLDSHSPRRPTAIKFKNGPDMRTHWAFRRVG